MPELHIIVNTHTPQRLRRTLLGVACQTRRADSVTLSCDSDNAEIESAARAACAEFGMSLTLIQRAHTGKSRPAQSRNNAVRELLKRSPPPDPASLLLFFDGDMVPEPRCAEKHEALVAAKAPTSQSRGRWHGVVLGWRYDLSPEQDAAFDEAALRAGTFPITPSAEQDAALVKREKRFKRQAFLRRLGIGKEHKPKVLGAHFSVPLATYLAVNGHDETYEDYAQEDDDFGRRVYLSGGRPVIAITSIHTFHQYHVTRQPKRWEDCPNAHRLLEPCAAVCARGIENPLDQPAVRVVRL